MKKLFYCRMAFAPLAALVGFTAPSSAQNVYFTNSSLDHDWFAATSWCRNTAGCDLPTPPFGPVPTSSDHAVIGSDLNGNAIPNSQAIVSTAGATANILNVVNAANLWVLGSGASLSVGALNVGGGSDFSSTVLIGNGATVSATSVQVNQFSNLLIGNFSSSAGGGLVPAPTPDVFDALNATSIALAVTGNLEINANTTINALITGGGGVALDGGTTALTGVNTYSGSTGVRAGARVVVTNNSSVGSGTVALLNGGIFQAGANNLAFFNQFQIGTTGTFDTNGNNLLISGTIFDTGGESFTPGTVVKIGAGTLTLAGSNTYLGGTNINAGTIQVTNNNSVGAGAVSLSGGAFQAGANNLSFANAFTVATSGTIDTNGNALTLSGPISGAGSLSKIGVGLLNLTNANSSVGTFSNLAGNLNIAAGAVLADTTFNNAATATVATGARLNSTGNLNNSGILTIAGTMTAANVTNTGTLTNTGTVTDSLTNSGVANVATNTGTITNGGTWTGNVLSNANTVTNNGTWTGNIVANTGTITNNMLWNGNIASSGTFTNNSGTITGSVANAGLFSATGTSSISGALNNSGTINLRSATVGNSLTVGSYVGNPGSAILFNFATSTSTSDHFNVTGTASGTTAISVVNTTPSAPFAISPNLITVGAGSTATFTPLTTTGFGMTSPTLTSSASGTGQALSLGIVSMPTASAASGAIVTLATQSIGFQTSDIVTDHMSDVRTETNSTAHGFAEESLAYTSDGKPTNAFAAFKAPPLVVGPTVRPAIWIKAFGDYEDRNASGSSTFGATTSSLDLGYVQRTGGVIAGADALIKGLSSANDALIVGGFLGSLNSDVQLKSAPTTQNYDGGNVGLYATYLRGNWFTDLLVKADILNLKINGVGLSQSTGLVNYNFASNIGYRFDLTNKYYVEPTAGIEYLVTNYNAQTALTATTVALTDGDAFRARIGARVGTEYLVNGIRIEPSLTGYAYGLLSQSNPSTLLVNGGGISLPTDLGKTFGMFQGAVNFFNLKNGVSGFVRADTWFGNGLLGGSAKAGLRYQM
jgi:outer membrane autotransporter protein